MPDDLLMKKKRKIIFSKTEVYFLTVSHCGQVQNDLLYVPATGPGPAVGNPWYKRLLTYLILNINSYKVR